MKKIVCLLMSLLVFSLSSLAQTVLNPIVPMEIILKGRQAVTQHLLKDVDHVTITYAGQSVVSSVIEYVGIDELKRLGYTHVGSFGEMSAALSSKQFSQEVIPAPGGDWYDVQVNIVYYDKEGRTLLTGSGYLYITRDDSGNLTAGEFQPSVSINPNVDTKVPATLYGAKWTSLNSSPLDLAIRYGGDIQDQVLNSTITIPVSHLGDGYFAFVDNTGEVTAYDLSNGSSISAKRIFAHLGLSRSSDVEVLNNPSDIGAGNNQFYVSYGKIYGHFPLRELILPNGLKTVVFFTVNVWGMEMQVIPTHIYVTPLFVNQKGGGDLIEGTEYEVFVQEKGGGWLLTLPPGEFHMRTMFDNVLDWNEDANGKG